LAHVHYGVHLETIRRWRKDPKVGFPPPDLEINGRGYWKDETIERFDASRAPTARKAAADPTPERDGVAETAA